jgi:hypothetical protein
MNRSFLFYLSACLLLSISLSGCKPRAKEDIYVNTNRRVIGVISEVLKVKKEKVIRSYTLAQLGLIPEKNEATLKSALEEEFDILIKDEYVKPNKTVENLSSRIATFRAIAGQSTFGPIKNEPRSSVKSVPESDKPGRQTTQQQQQQQQSH